MIGKVYTTDQRYVEHLDCNPAVYKRVYFQSCNLDIKQGSSILSTVSLCDFKLESLGSSELGGCGGSVKKSITLGPSSNYTLTAPEIGQAQGEVQMIVVKVKYEKDHPDNEKFLTWEYKGETYPIRSLMVLTGRTDAEISWQGWDLSYYSNNPPTPIFSPHLYPVVSSPNLSFGGIMFSNLNDTYSTELEIFVFN
jgi:hypothetical protein